MNSINSMNKIDLDINHYTENELLDIAEIPGETSKKKIEEKFTLLIKQYLSNKNYEIANFFHEAKEKILNQETNDKENKDNKENKEKVEQSEDWLSNQYREPVNENQKSKITDRSNITSIFDGNSRQVMTQKQLGINNNYSVNVIQDTLNPTLRQLVKHYITINSVQRYNSIPFVNNLNSKSLSSNFTVNLNNPINNVISMKIESLNIPNTIYAFDTLYENNVMMLLTSKKNIREINWENLADISSCTRISLASGSYKNPIDFVNQLNLDIKKCLGTRSTVSLFGSTDTSGCNIGTPSSNCFMSLQVHLADPLSISPRIVFINTNEIYNIKIVFYKQVGIGDTFTYFEDYTNCVTCSPQAKCRSTIKSTYNNNLGYHAGYRIESFIDDFGNTLYINTNTIGSELSIVLEKVENSSFYQKLSKINQSLPGLYINYTMQQYAEDINNLLYLNSVNNYNFYNIANVPINLIASDYLFVCINDFNQNRSSDGIITVAAQESINYKLSSTKMATWSSATDLNGQILDLNSNLISYKDANTGEQKELFVPSLQKKLTQAQIYSLNEINLNKKKQTDLNYDLTKIENVLAAVTFKNGENIEVIENNLRKREYFGPVKIDRLEIMLKNSKGNLINLNGQDWTFNIVLEQLYQY